MNTTNTGRWNHLPFVTQALARWYRGTDSRTAQTATWYRAMAIRLHAAAQQADESYRSQLLRCARLARQYAAHQAAA
jgi:hypothetical protein